MNPVGLDSLAQYLGPGVGGQWMGEREALAQETDRLTQQKTLEDIATATQNRDIAKQKLPFELQNLETTGALQKAQAAESAQRTAGAQEKLKKENYNDFLTGLSQMNMVGMTDRAEYLNELSKRTGVPAGHPMYGIALQMHAQAQNNPKVWEEFKKAFTVSPETVYKEEQSNARTDRSNDRMEANTRLIQDTNERIRREDREAKLKIAEMRQQEAQKAALQKNYMVAALHFRGAAQAAEQAGDQEKARFYYAESFRNEELDRQQKAAGANAPGKQPLDIPGMPPRQAPPAPPGPGPAGSPPAAASTPAGPVVKWGRDKDGKPIRLQ